MAPTIVPYTTSFCPLGNTPVVSLTRSLPQGEDADILLLGCGDVRNVLYTTYSERGFPARRLDITSCDIEPAVIARNVLLLTLLIEGVSADSMWKVYFHFSIDNDTLNIIQSQAKKLLAVSKTIDQWRNGPYSSLLKFCDVVSLREASQVWEKYVYLRSDRVTRFKEDLRRTESLRRTILGRPGQQEPLTLTSLRSAAPLSIPALANGEIIQAYEYYWKHGHLSDHQATIPNPLFSETLSENTVLHYGTNPLLGFHLATAFAKLEENSPLRPSHDDSDAFNVVSAARIQFHEWVEAFKEIAKEKKIVLRFITSDALALTYALQNTSVSDITVNLFRKQLDAAPIELDPVAYGATGSAPKRFDVIDTSSLADHLHTLNILVATTALLKNLESSTLWTETLLKRGEKFEDKILCGHASTVSLLLGVFPVDYWTNATAVSCVDETVLGSVTSSQQSRSRSAWKLTASLQSHQASPLYIQPEALAEVMFDIYTEMFPQQNIMAARHLLDIDDNEFGRIFTESLHPQFDRGSFAAFLRRVKANVSTMWESFWKKFLKMISESPKTALDQTHWMDLVIQLHLAGLLAESAMKGPIRSNPHVLSGHFAWKDIPEAVCLTVVVPRSRVSKAFASERIKTNAPTLEGILDVGKSQNSFGNVHVVFGHVETFGRKDDDDFSVTICQDPLGWQGTAPLIASFYVASKTLNDDPERLTVGVGFFNSLFNINYWDRDGVPSIIHSTTLSDSSNVFVSKHEPGMSGYPFTVDDGATTTGAALSTNDNKPVTTQICANLEGIKLVSLCACVDFESSQQAKALFEAEIKATMCQSSPLTIDLKSKAGEIPLPCSISFPTPVDLNKVCIERSHRLMEVVAHIASPLYSENLATHIYSMALIKDHIPVALNSYIINLDSLPALNVSKHYTVVNKWLEMLVTHQFSLRERKIFEEDRPTSRSLRVDFKESVFSMFMRASGLRGVQTNIFAIEDTGGGNQLLIFVRAILIHGAEGSVAMDAAVVPITHQLINSGKLEAFLRMLPEQPSCAKRVGDEEFALWKRAIPAFAERCRTWSHGPNCEYKMRGATVPLTTTPGEQFICSCGNGQLPPGFIKLPGWDEVAAKHAVRVAISPTFAAPCVEDSVDMASFLAHGGLDGINT
ncbi:hypothetical protein GGR53DRAFT_410482 [Hypoxylon sp. FL1150]|nr:hypothetical protein GGR53DRAFT_410482 [Hypoxylon sp. FL1150]